MSKPDQAHDYRMRLATELKQLDSSQWNALVGKGPGNIFARYEWLNALEQTGCVGDGTGWQPLHLVLEDSNQHLIGAVPLYGKTHSYGEYVFDWAWADAYQRNGLRYYPKLLSSIPFTPIAGARLLAKRPEHRALLARGLLEQARRTRVSSLHVLFPLDDDRLALAEQDMMIREGVQFHWVNAGFAHFDEFLSALNQKKRKKIRAERRKIREAGVVCHRLLGSEISEADWAFFYQCYETTYREHHSTPYLSPEFFQAVAQSMPEAFIMIRAELDQVPIAASLLVRDNDRIYGRYWGSLQWVSQLHFEVAYYQTIEAAIELDIAVIEGGAQGEHKMARGFTPVSTCSAHWLAEPSFADAVERFLSEESDTMSGYIDELNDRQPFRSKS